MNQAVLTQVRRLTASEDGVRATARERAAGSRGTPLPSPEVGTLLCFLAASAGARHAVEIGSAAGLTGLWLLAGMAGRGVLTTIEQDPHRHELAGAAYADSGAADRVRLVLGEPLSVLPRLSDGGYELCIVQGAPSEYVGYLEHAVRLLRPGGVLVARDLFRTGDGAEARATFVQRLADDDRLTATVLPIDDGTALATVRAA